MSSQGECRRWGSRQAPGQVVGRGQQLRAFQQAILHGNLHYWMGAQPRECVDHRCVRGRGQAQQEHAFDLAGDAGDAADDSGIQTVQDGVGFGDGGIE